MSAIAQSTPFLRESRTRRCLRNKLISAIHWSETSVIACIRRGQQVIIPHGSTVLCPGDVLVVVNHGPIAAEFDTLCERQPDATL